MTEGDSLTIKSDRTLLSILTVLGDRERAGVTEIASEIGRAKSTVHGHLQSLREAGLVVRDGDEYRLSLAFLNFGKGVQTTHPIYEVAEPKVDELAEISKEKAWCFVEQRGYAVYLLGSQGENATKTPARVGHHRHIHQLAGGKAILAHLPEDRLAEIIADHGLPSATSHTITDESALRSELEAIRERGFSLNVEEAMTGLNAISVPVLDVEGGVYGALSIGGPAHRLTREHMEEELAPMLLGIANEVEINIRHW
ncbi:IclR family transcriptional regulator [Halorarum halobium]|uniref:IclR family transcriptional regulator n=1 Tax=Halorarum halobium TaxID=3075121 RepID=UPI0028B216F4|nr:IclR family transcriptional regulator [Halobaculum sp. XH14]